MRRSRTGGYSQAVRLENFERLLFVSGQVPTASEGRLPGGFEAQARQVWLNIDAQLEGGGHGQVGYRQGDDLSRRPAATRRPTAKCAANIWVRCSPAMTVVIAGLFDSAWLLEVEVVAAQ